MKITSPTESNHTKKMIGPARPPASSKPNLQMKRKREENSESNPWLENKPRKFQYTQKNNKSRRNPNRLFALFTVAA